MPIDHFMFKKLITTNGDIVKDVAISLVSYEVFYIVCTCYRILNFIFLDYLTISFLHTLKVVELIVTIYIPAIRL